MLIRGLLNPHVWALLAQVRHTNTLVIADRGFPSWKDVPTVDLSLVDGVPTVEQVLAAILPLWRAGPAWMAEEFLAHNPPEAAAARRHVLAAAGVTLGLEPHVAFKRRVPAATGLIRTADVLPYSNIILESA